MTGIQTLDDGRPAVAIDQQREEATRALIANKPGFDVAAISDEEFEQGLERIRIRQQRMKRILETILVENVHYGNPKTRDGRPIFQRPILLQAGAEELRNLFRLRLRHVHNPAIVETPTYVSVTVTVAIEDGAGRLSAPRSGNCNTMEKRFERRDGKGYTYTDAREMVHQCLAMAEKRAAAFATKEVTGANAFFSALEEDAMVRHLEEEAETDEPWTDEQRQTFYREAMKAGLKTREQVQGFVESVIGPGAVGQKDVDRLYQALEARKGAARPVQDGSLGLDDTPKPAA